MARFFTGLMLFFTASAWFGHFIFLLLVNQRIYVNEPNTAILIVEVVISGAISVWAIYYIWPRIWKR